MGYRRWDIGDGISEIVDCSREQGAGMLINGYWFEGLRWVGEMKKGATLWAAPCGELDEVSDPWIGVRGASRRRGRLGRPACVA